MGTDIYLSWDGQTEAEKKAQYTGYSIEAGKVGYLRASIGMEKENAILRELFPNEIWEKSGSSDDGLPFDFNQGYAVLNVLAKKYMASVLFGIPIKKNHVQVKHEQWVKNVTEYLTHVKKFDHVENPDVEGDMDGAVAWLNSLFLFVRLGMSKQEKKLNPKVLISR